MSLARRAVLSASRVKPVFTAIQSRAGSSSAHHDDHHHHEEDNTVYPPETFTTPFWRNVLFLSIGTVIAVKYAPAPGEDVYLTRWIAMYKPSPELWLERNAMRTVHKCEQASAAQVHQDAKAPPVFRFSYPQSMTQASPFSIVTGKDVDMSSVVAKQTHDEKMITTS